MKILRSVIALVAISANAAIAFGHGFSLSVNYNNSFTPVSLTAASQEGFFDTQQVTAAPTNMFIEEFSSAETGSAGTYMPVIHGFVQTAGPWLPYTATYNVISPLYFSDGTINGPHNTVVATEAPVGTYIDMYDLWAGNPEPTLDPHPGAAFGDVYITGQSSFEAGYGVSLYDTHEMEKDLYIGSGDAYGEYGFAFDIVVHFSDGVTLASAPLVNVFATSDPNYGDFAENASYQQQDAASEAIYQAVMAAAAPEPSSLSLVAIAAGLLGLRRWLNGRSHCLA
ncbi:MAG TPA: PEP-CTERM sorting domain-containing protein [Pirellulales bacterium]|nr:PEP-CTERM sorting domain-containing protein [Pirellulales bacterium]